MTRQYKKFITAALLTLLAFIIGVLIGYFSKEAWQQIDPRITILDTINREADNSITQKLFDRIDTKQLDKTLRKLTESPRLAGTNSNREAGYYVHQEFLQYGLESEVVEYNVTLSYPDNTDENYAAVIEEDGTEVFKTQVNVVGDEVSPYNAYSPSGRVRGDLVFVNYARPSDFQLLEEKGINCTGYIVIAKYGKLFKGNKVNNAHKAGAIGMILYSDPADYALYSNVSGTYPDSIFLPDDGAQRGNIVLNKGDQSTPGYPANEYMHRLTNSELNKRLPKIPCLPISYGNAYNLLRHMSGDDVPDTWKGGLNITYKTGPKLNNSRKIVLNVRNRLENRKIYNVVGKIKGDIEPDRYVIIGNHRDAWVYGAADPMSGGMVLLEIARVFGQQLQTGWRPRRTILFCSWDAEEFGLIGSFEWVEDNIKWLYPSAVAYINIDTAVAGNETIHLRTVPLLQNVFKKAMDKVPDPHGRFKSFYEYWRNHPSYKMHKIGGGSDQVPFIAVAGIPSAYGKFVKIENIWKSLATPLYHSRYEDYHAYKLFDPEMKFAKTWTSIMAEIARNLADSRIIPFDVVDYADYITTATKELSDLYGQYFSNVSIEYLRKSSNTFYESSTKFMTTLETSNGENPLLIRELNDKLISLERSFLIDEGLPGQTAFKHVLHSPGSADYYTGKSFPGLGAIQECYDSGSRLTCLPEIEKHLTVIIHRIYAAAKILNG